MTGYIHIGAPKCGSSTIQSLVARNALAIRDSGIGIFQDANFGNQLAHRFVSGWLPDEAQERSNTQDTFLHDHRNSDIFLSSEAYLALAQNPANLNALLSLIGQDNLNILAIIRDPASLLESTWFQWMRTYRTFPKVRSIMDERGVYYKKYLDSNWFEMINLNWQRWRTNASVTKFTPIYMDLIDRFDPSEILQDFLGRRISLTEQSGRVNESMNGVTFRLLKEFRSVRFSDYRSFVTALDKETSAQGYGKYRFLSDNMARQVTQSAGQTELFAPYLDAERTAHPNAQDLETSVYAKLLKKAEAMATEFAPRT